MMLREPTALAAPRITSLSLDFGADDQECAEQAVQFSEQAMHMRCRWRFEVGTQLGVSFVCDDPAHGKKRLIVEGMVVGCDPCGGHPKAYQTTVLFFELPDDLQQCLRELSRRQGAAL